MPYNPEDEGDGDNYLAGLCYFPGPEALLPTQVHIASGVGVLDLIKDLVIKNPEGAGIKTVGWNPTQPIPEKVLGIVVDQEMIDYLQESNNGRGILLKEANADNWMTLKEWEDKFQTNGLALIARMRLDWNKTGGGIKPTHPSDKKFVVLGGAGRKI